VAFIALFAGAVIGTSGVVGHSPPLILLGGALLSLIGAFLAPQLLLAVYLVAGGLKAAPWLSGIPGDLTVITAIGLLVAMVIGALRAGALPDFPAPSALAVGLAALVVLSLFWSPAPELGLDKSLRFESFTMLAFFAPLVLVRSRADLRQLMICLVLVSLVVAATAVPGKGNQALIIAGGTSEIELALYATSGVVAVAGYLLLVGRSRWRFLWIVPAVYLAKIVIDAGSRGVLIGTIVAMLTIGIRAVLRSSVKLVPIAVMVAAAIGLVIFASSLSGPAAAKYQTLLGSSETTTLGKRNYLLQDGIDLALAHPMGRGAGGYTYETNFTYPHNALVEVADEQGIIGLTLLLGLIIAAFRYSLRAREGPLSPEAILAGALLIVLVADAMVSQTFTQFRELWFAMGLALAVPAIAPRGPLTRPDAPVRLDAPPAARALS
jgi:O-antigen ligase